MDTTRGISIAAGAIFIVAGIAGLAAPAIQPHLAGSNDLAGVAGHPNQVAVSALLYLIAAGTSVGIAIALYPVLKEVSAGLAMASVVFRTIEAVFYTVAVVSFLSIWSLGQQFATATAADRAAIQVMANSLLSVRDHATVTGVFAYCTGAMIYYVLFYRSRLVPRWLSVWGMVGILLMLTACVLALFRNNAVTGYVLLILPILIQEYALAIWLLIKGFSPSARVFGASPQTPTSTTAHT